MTQKIRPFQGMGYRVLPDFPEQCKPLTSVIGSGKSNFRPEQYTCLADRRKNRQEEGRCGEGKRKTERKKTKEVMKLNGVGGWVTK